MNCPDRLGLHPGPAMFRYVLPCPVSPPMQRDQARLLDPRRIGQHQTSRRVGTWRRPTRSQWSAMIRELASVAWMSCSGGSCRFGLRTSKVGFANINAKAEAIEGRLREAFQPPRSLVPVDVFTSGRRPGRGSNPVKTLRVLTSRGLWGNQVGSDQPSAERQRSSSLTRISILIIAADSRTIHSEYVGKTTGPEAMLAATRLVGHLGRGQKDQIN